VCVVEVRACAWQWEHAAGGENENVRLREVLFMKKGNKKGARGSEGAYDGRKTA